MYTSLIKTIFIIFFINILNPVFTQQGFEPDCYSIMAGKNATTDKSVILAHNEDDYGEFVFSFYKVPAAEHQVEKLLITDTDVRLPQVSRTYSYLWIDMPQLQFSDSYMNEWGVTIASDQCLSREDKGEIEDGGIGYYLRRLMAERSKTARQAVKIGGYLVEKYGYNASGRTYCIADPDEIWMMAVVKGKHWVAKRVPSDHVAVISNCYTIGEIDLRDTINFLGSNDIVEYAVKRGWYDPDSGKKFNFKYAYALEGSIDSDGNKPRQLAAINFLSQKQFKLTDDLPFSFEPANKVSKENLMKILSNHFENTGMRDMENILDEPHHYKYNTICSSGNQYGFVAQLRKEMPSEIGNVMWIAMKRPCIQPYMPVYLGVSKFPGRFTYGDHVSALKDHFAEMNRKELMKESAFWQYLELSGSCDRNYRQLHGFIQFCKERTEKDLLKNQALFEETYLSLYGVNKASASEYLDSYVSEVMMKNLHDTEKLLSFVK
ncbi:MAG: dipeptidase [Deltaproteobacteria bacterium]